MNQFMERLSVVSFASREKEEKHRNQKRRFSSYRSVNKIRHKSFRKKSVIVDLCCNAYRRRRSVMR